MRVNTYNLLEECVERGIIGGLRKADKYDQLQLPDVEKHAQATITRYVMDAITEYFNWDDEIT